MRDNNISCMISGTKNTTGTENDWHYEILNMEAFFNDEHYDPEDIVKSTTSRTISSLYQKINENTKANYPEEENKVDKGTYLPRTCHSRFTTSPNFFILIHRTHHLRYPDSRKNSTIAL